MPSPSPLLKLNIWGSKNSKPPRGLPCVINSLTKVMFISRTGIIRTARETSAPGAKCKEAAWWLRLASRDPKGTPEMSY
uniref:Uncharacterized protein n=1 Tax=Rhizophora mucronata TaxID=61149 RepID=A0A2P2LI94_RHIMU